MCQIVEVILDHFSGKRLEKLQNMPNWPFQVISDHFGGEDWKSCKTCRVGNFGPLPWENIGKVAKFAIPKDFGPLQWEKTGKVAKHAKLAIPSHFSRKSCETCQICHSKQFQTTFCTTRLVWKRLQKLQNVSSIGIQLLLC